MAVAHACAEVVSGQNRGMHATPPLILVTGFEPFGGQRINPSWEVARHLQGRSIADAQVQALQLPCVFGQALDVLRQALHTLQPVLVLALGQADGRSDISVERVAINVNDARIADNAGRQPVDTPVVAGAPAAYFSTLPIKRIVAGLRAQGLPASVSQTAGTFVCNHVFYGLMHALAGQSVRAGFIHLPLLPGQAAAWPGATPPSLCLDLQVQGIALAAGLALEGGPDLQQSGGAVA